MHVQPPDNPTEDSFIALLDRGIRISERADELAAIRLQMRMRESARLKFLLRAAKTAMQRP